MSNFVCNRVISAVAPSPGRCSRSLATSSGQVSSIVASAPAPPPPLVLLLGWLGCSRRHLSKYAELYLDRGTVVSMSPTLGQTALPRCAAAEALRYSHRVEAAQSGTEGGGAAVLVHVMSNAGWLAFGSLLHLASLPAATQLPPHLRSPSALHSVAALRGTLARVRGMVIDSAPSAAATPSMSARGFVSAALGKPAAGIEVEHPVAVGVAARLAEHYLARPAVSAWLHQMQSAWAASAPLAPQLYLYSQADVLIPASDVEDFMAKQAQRGVSVSSRCWADSGHVEHLQCHPEEYRRLVRSFMQQCLA